MDLNFISYKLQKWKLSFPVGHSFAGDYDSPGYTGKTLPDYPTDWRAILQSDDEYSIIYKTFTTFLMLIEWFPDGIIRLRIIETIEIIMDTIQVINTHQMMRIIQEGKAKIIDVRQVDAYNGWKLRGEKRGGHIPGAKSLDAKWTDYIDWIEIVRSKGLLENDKLVLYGYDRQEIEKVAKCLKKSGYKNIAVYNGFKEEWSSDPELPMEQLARYRNLVPPQWVKAVMEGRETEEPPSGKTIVVHSHYRNRYAYLSGHIPGAIDMDTLALEAPETWNRRSPGELENALKKHGITAGTTVVLYGKYMDPDNADEFPGSAAGDIGAMRNAFIMLYAGVKDVRILNGGFQSWKDAGYSVSTEDIPKQPVKEFGETIPARRELAVDVPEAKEMIKAEDADIVCVRSWREYIGEVSGYNYIEKKGRIPGAIFGNCGSDAYHMENYRNLDHTIRAADEIAEKWKQVGITPDKHLAFYCGTGWRGSEAFFNAWLMGFPRVSVFDGGWFEWSNDPENPYETGIPCNVEQLMI